MSELEMMAADYAYHLFVLDKQLTEIYQLTSSKYGKLGDESIANVISAVSRSHSAALAASNNFRGQFRDLPGLGSEQGRIRVRFYVCGPSGNGQVSGSMDVLVRASDAVSAAYEYADSYLQGLKERNQSKGDGRTTDSDCDHDIIEPIMVTPESEVWTTAKTTEDMHA
jgi:hypothetical protein